jgi:hypothetical protein
LKPFLATSLTILLVIALSAGTIFLASENNNLKTYNDKQSTNLTQLQTELNQTRTNLTQTRFTLKYLEENYAQLLTSNITPPISKLRAVEIALTAGRWNESTLRGLEVEASLQYVRIFKVPNSQSGGYEILHSVTEPVDDYSPRVEYNVMEPWGGGMVGTLWYRYVWVVSLQRVEGMRGIPPPGLYSIDASTGDWVD